jgi:hypothetical protein
MVELVQRLTPASVFPMFGLGLPVKHVITFPSLFHRPDLVSRSFRQLFESSGRLTTISTISTITFPA